MQTRCSIISKLPALLPEQGLDVGVAERGQADLVVYVHPDVAAAAFNHICSWLTPSESSGSGPVQNFLTESLAMSSKISTLCNADAIGRLRSFSD